ncbi:Mycobacterium rhizamassiliense ORFan [Mycobacterium rhizamassiliense]|uniref:Mycobacterium rhizamassiliense ORFan n=1 Tax=Mycobacterium rhizamassiliense TaxID=1841860 RepID=A0A2U3NQ60_9MYCO|nr:hypothetical protein [Mycobacterium rhizamassiliense]SPM33658.1 Mycobacterium rhizamassiliense ORFan [Mycobacterium rhizamassiliense]
MLQRDPRIAARHVWQRVGWWWRRGPARLRLRRHLSVYFLPVALVLLAVVGKIISAMLTGDAAVSDFAHHDIDALRDDVSTLSGLNVIEPGQVSFIAGDLAVLEGKLDTAEQQFAAALQRIDNADSCPARINLELVRETQGDLAANRADVSHAEERYNSALQVITDAPPRCFKDNDDPNLDRRRIRNDAAARLADKIKALHLPPAKPPNPAQTASPSPPPTSLTETQLPPPPPPGPPRRRRRPRRPAPAATVPCSGPTVVAERAMAARAHSTTSAPTASRWAAAARHPNTAWAPAMAAAHWTACRTASVIPTRPVRPPRTTPARTFRVARPGPRRLAGRRVARRPPPRPGPFRRRPSTSARRT